MGQVYASLRNCHVPLLTKPAPVGRGFETSFNEFLALYEDSKIGSLVDLVEYHKAHSELCLPEGQWKSYPQTRISEPDPFMHSTSFPGIPGAGHRRGTRPNPGRTRSRQFGRWLEG